MTEGYQPEGESLDRTDPPRGNGILDENPDMTDEMFEKAKNLMRRRFKEKGLVLVLSGNFMWVEKADV